MADARLRKPGMVSRGKALVLGLSERREEELRRKRVAPLMSLARSHADPLKRARLVHAARTVPALARGASKDAGVLHLSDDDDQDQAGGEAARIRRRNLAMLRHRNVEPAIEENDDGEQVRVYATVDDAVIAAERKSSRLGEEGGGEPVDVFDFFLIIY
jgi:hypothetical protein